MSAADLAQARAHLEALTGQKNPAVTFQTFADAKDPKAKKDPLARWLHGTLDRHAAELEKLNNKGAGIFIMVNEGDGRGRSAKNVTRIRALYADEDKPDARPPALEPSFSVTTSPGKRHDYLLVAGEMPLKDFTPFQEALADYCGSDRSVNDLPRVARLAGFWHTKKGRVLVRFEPGSGRNYTPDEIRAAHPVKPKAPAPPKPTTTSVRPPLFRIEFDPVTCRREKLQQIIREKAEGRSWTEGNRHASAKATAVHARKLGLEEAEFRPIVVDLLERAGKTREEAEDLVTWTMREVAPDPKEAERSPAPKADAPIADAQDDDEDDDDGEEKPEAEKLSAAAELIAIGRKAELLCDERGDGYAVFDSDGVRRALKMRSSEFSRELQRRFAEKHDYQRAANGEALASARAVLEALATNKGERVHLTNRFARRGDALYLDTADPRWRAIKITPGKWELIARPPTLFRRYAHQHPLPEPLRGGDAGKLVAPFALSEADRILVLAWAVAALVGDIPRPVLCAHGPQGSGKTTLLKMLLSVLDPSGADDLDLGNEPRELAQVLDAHAVCFFDNLTRINEWQARLLCKAATGGGFEKRRLYSDEDSVILTFRRAVCFTGINIPSTAPDLLDRTLLIQMERMEPERRRQEDDLWRDFETAQPEILGGLLDALAEAMAIRPTLKLRELPRMADFGSWGEAISRALGFEAGAFLTAYTENVSGQVDEILEADPVARFILSKVEREKETFTGTTETLFSMMKEKHGEEMKEKDAGWPKSPALLGKRLRTLHATLNDAGVSVVWDRNPGGNRRRTVTIAQAVNIGKIPSQPSQPSRSGTAGTDGTANFRVSPATPDEAAVPFRKVLP